MYVYLLPISGCPSSEVQWGAAAVVHYISTCICVQAGSASLSFNFQVRSNRGGGAVVAAVRDP